MKAIQLEKAYDPKQFEQRLYEQWETGGYFKPQENASSEKAFTVVIPPPNVTGVLHIGHGLNNTLQDIVVRYHRMKGDKTLWVPGTDHAGIATQNVVERRLKQEGKSRRDFTREEFVKRTWQVKEEHHEIIVRQLKKLGASVDWSR
ncbi:MAG: class I tRNA ligase family protein, partial [Spirochaetales bacterium]